MKYTVLMIPNEQTPREHNAVQKCTAIRVIDSCHVKSDLEPLAIT